MDQGADELEHQLFTAHDCSQKSSSISSSDDDSGNSSEEDSGEEADNSSEGDEDSDVSQFGIEFNLLNTYNFPFSVCWWPENGQESIDAATIRSIFHFFKQKHSFIQFQICSQLPRPMKMMRTTFKQIEPAKRLCRADVSKQQLNDDWWYITHILYQFICSFFGHSNPHSSLFVYSFFRLICE